MKKILAIAFVLWVFVNSTLRAQVFDVDTLVYQGQKEQHINIVILGDGYTEDQMNDFIRDANKFTGYLFQKAPYSNYKNFFNVFIIKTPSPESGVKHPQTASDCSSAAVPMSNPNNYFGSTFDAYGIHRLLVPMNYAALSSVMANNFPDYDQAFVLANSPYYGGSGGHFATASLNSLSNEIAVHEIGHSFANLADEYWAGEIYAAEKPNMTRYNDPATIIWKNWLTKDTGIGIHQHPGHPWYKPANGTCEMEALQQAYCHVCSQAIVERIHELVNSVKGHYPSSDSQTIGRPEYFSLDLIKPIPNTLKTEWMLNSTSIGKNMDSVLIDPSALMDGTNHISVTVLDTSALTRSDEHQISHVSVTRWTVVKAATGIKTVYSDNSQMELKLYPNPASDLLNVSFKSQQQEKVTLVIYSGQGVVKHKKVINARAATETTGTVDIREWPAGSYYLEIKTGDFTLSEQFIKR